MPDLEPEAGAPADDPVTSEVSPDAAIDADARAAGAYPETCPKCQSPRYDSTPNYAGRVYDCGSGWFEEDRIAGVPQTSEFVEMAACPIIASLREDLSEWYALGEELISDNPAMTPMEALISATRWGGQIMMRKDLGEIREGWLADLLLVDGDPLANISMLQDKSKLLAIMKDGEFTKSPEIRSTRSRFVA